MKSKINKIITVLLVMFLASPGLLQAQENESKSIVTEAGKDNFALLLHNSEHLKASVKTAKQLKQHDGFNVGKIEVVICGKEVMNLKTGSELTSVIQEGIAEGIEFNVCGMSLEKFGIKNSELIDGLKVVPNGFIRGFELQKAGYLIIEL